jgi:phosphoesterase RecJ-like protein
VLDSASLKRVGEVESLICDGVPVINIDHHRSNVEFGQCNLIMEKQSSTVEVVYLFSRFCGVPLSKAIAEYVYTGIVCDTGRFLFPNTTQTSLSICAEMISAGARPDYIADRLYFRTSRSTIKALADSLATLEFHLDGKVSSMVLTNGMMPEEECVDTEGFVDYLLAIEGTEVEFFMMEKQPGRFKVSFRSKMNVDVNAIAQQLGGGGHKRASGCTVEGDLQSIKNRILGIIETRL